MVASSSRHIVSRFCISIHFHRRSFPLVPSLTASPWLYLPLLLRPLCSPPSSNRSVNPQRRQRKSEERVARYRLLAGTGIFHRVSGNQAFVYGSLHAVAYSCACYEKEKWRMAEDGRERDEEIGIVVGEGAGKQASGKKWERPRNGTFIQRRGTSHRCTRPVERGEERSARGTQAAGYTIYTRKCLDDAYLPAYPCNRYFPATASC